MNRTVISLPDNKGTNNWIITLITETNRPRSNRSTITFEQISTKSQWALLQRNGNYTEVQFSELITPKGFETDRLIESTSSDIVQTFEDFCNGTSHFASNDEKYHFTHDVTKNAGFTSKHTRTKPSFN